MAEKWCIDSMKKGFVKLISVRLLWWRKHHGIAGNYCKWSHPICQQKRFCDEISLQVIVHHTANHGGQNIKRYPPRQSHWRPWQTLIIAWLLHEHLWDEHDQRVRRGPHPPRTHTELKATLPQEWLTIPQRKIRNIIRFMNCQFALVIQGHSWY